MKKTLLTTLLAASVSFASSTTNLDSTSTVDIKPTVWDKIAERSSLSFFIQTFGPGLNNLMSNPDYKIDSETGELDRERPTQFWMQPSYSYKINDDTKVLVNPRFSIYTAPRKVDGKTENNRLEMYSPIAGIAQRYQITEKFTISAQYLTNVFNVNESHREDKLLFNPGGWNTINYQANSKVGVGSWVWYNLYFYEEGNADKQRYYTYIAPYVTYALNDIFTARGFVEMNYGHAAGETLGTTERDDFTVNVAMDINLKGWGMMPLVKSNMTNAIGTQATEVGIWIWGSIL